MSSARSSGRVAPPTNRFEAGAATGRTATGGKERLKKATNRKNAVGCTIRKNFTAGTFTGEIMSSSEGLFQVVYSDGDKEDLTWKELMECCTRGGGAPPSAPAAPKKSTAAHTIADQKKVVKREQAKLKRMEKASGGKEAAAPKKKKKKVAAPKQKKRAAPSAASGASKKAKKPAAAASGAAKPRGRPPAGKSWDSVKGEWAATNADM